MRSRVGGMEGAQKFVQRAEHLLGELGGDLVLRLARAGEQLWQAARARAR